MTRSLGWLTAAAAVALVAGAAVAEERPASDGRIRLAQQSTDKGNPNAGHNRAPSRSNTAPHGPAAHGPTPHTAVPHAAPKSSSGGSGGHPGTRPYAGGHQGPPATAYRRSSPSGRSYDRGYIRSHGNHFAWGSGFWFYDGWYYGDCEWLRQRAIATGDDYWWERFQTCRDW